MLSVVGDQRQNIWVLRDQKLEILAGERWLDPTRALRATGSPTGTVRFLTAVGDGSKVYVTDWDRFGALGEVRDGAAVFTKAPYPTVFDALRLFRTVREKDGGFWVPARWSSKGVSGLFPQKITEAGVVAEVEGIGWPLLGDLSGNVWFGKGTRDSIDCLNIWRGGKMIATLPLVGGGKRVTLFSNKAGCVYAWTDIGLQRFRTSDPLKPTEFEATRWPLTGIDRHIASVEFSPLGFLVVTTEPMLHEQTGFIQLIRLP
jgi:hypothetical protein